MLFRKSTVLLNRKECTARLKKQADTMLERSVKRFKPAEVGDNVLVPVPDVDRGRGEFRNIKGIVTNDNGNGCYSIGTTEGTLKQAYCRAETNLFLHRLNSLELMTYKINWYTFFYKKQVYKKLGLSLSKT